MGRDVHALELPAAQSPNRRPVRPARAARIDNAARDSVPEPGRTAPRV
ncbi:MULTISPECIES: hypothetical protein [unclassified Streptomyces]|nr:hypothetical protein OG457_43325 [Streptomyces sp. NBC_01207]WTA23175.1 hypothetical protein OG365_37005 [Streptomyces sp. NBC_00853]